MIYWPAKAPGEAEQRSFDFTEVLQSGETITGTPTIAATGATAGSPSVSGAIVSMEVSGGTLGTPGVVVCTVTTTASNSYSQTAILPIGEEPVTLDMAKRQCRIVGTTDKDDLLLELIQAAREHVEKYCGIRIVTAAVLMTFATFTDLASLTQAPVQSITQVQYLDANGAPQTLEPSLYEFVNASADPLRPLIRLAYNQKWPPARTAEDAVQVSALVGYTAVPRPILRAILMLVGHWLDAPAVAFDMRGTPAEMPHAVEALLANFRR